MAITKYKTWLPNEILTSADLNASFDQVFDNQEGFGYPRTTSADFNGQTLILDADGDSTLRETSDDVIALRLQSVDLFIFDGDAASATTGLTFTAGTNAAPTATITAQGGPTDISVNITAKGAGTIGFVSTSGVTFGGKPLALDTDADSTLRETSDDVIALKLQNVDLFIFDGDAASVADGLTFRAAATGTSPEIAAQGSSTDIDVKLTPKGSGVVKLGSSTVTATSAATAVPVANGSGKLADGWIGESSVTQHAVASIVAAKGLRLLGTLSPSAASSVDLDSTLIAPSGYLPILVSWALSFSADADLYLRSSTNNGSSVDSGASHYSWATHGFNTTGALSSGDTADAQILLSDPSNVIGNAAAEHASGFVRMHHAGDGSHYPTFRFETSYIDNTARTSDVHGTGHRRSGTAVNFLRLLPSSGTVTGTVKVYGYPSS